ncbi:MAG: hypothetical protein ACXWIT_26655 [Burkholderiales bacterium]
METITDYAALSDQVRRLSRPVIVGVEGFTGSGKSSLADALAKDLGAFVAHTDDYVTGEDESLPYPDRLDYGRIQSVVAGAIAGSAMVIVEGICLREALRRSGVSAGLLVYVKRLAENGLWHDGFHLEDYETEAAIVENREEPHRSDFTYHSAERPHEQANIVFHRVEVYDEA